MNIIIKGKTKYGSTRSEQESNLRKDGYVGMSEENYDKCKWAEKKIKDTIGSSESFLRQSDIDQIK